MNTEELQKLSEKIVKIKFKKNEGKYSASFVLGDTKYTKSFDTSSESVLNFLKSNEISDALTEPVTQRNTSFKKMHALLETDGAFEGVIDVKRAKLIATTSKARKSIKESIRSYLKAKGADPTNRLLATVMKEKVSALYDFNKAITVGIRLGESADTLKKVIKEFESSDVFTTGDDDLANDIISATLDVVNVQPESEDAYELGAFDIGDEYPTDDDKDELILVEGVATESEKLEYKDLESFVDAQESDADKEKLLANIPAQESESKDADGKKDDDADDKDKKDESDKDKDDDKDKDADKAKSENQLKGILE